MSIAIERIVVPLDAVSEHQAAIDIAVRLAAQTGAPLHGVFIEDEELLHLAGLPFARQVTLGTGAKPVTTQEIEWQLRAAAERARKDLSAAAQQHQVKCSFEIARGGPTMIKSAATEGDLVVAGALTKPVTGQFRLGHRWWSSMETTTGTLLLARNVWSAPGAVVMLLRNREPGSVRLLEATAQVAAAKDTVLTVVCPRAIAGAEGFDQWLSQQIGAYSVPVQVEVVPMDPETLQERLARLDCRLLAVEAGMIEGGDDRLREMVEEFACDMLVVR